MKIRVLKIAARPSASLRSERDNLLGESDCLGARQSGLCRRQRDRGRSGRLRFGGAVCPGKDRDGSLLNLVNRHYPRGQEAKHNADAAGDAALAVSPTSHASGADGEQLGDAPLREAKRAECRAEFGCS